MHYNGEGEQHTSSQSQESLQLKGLDDDLLHLSNIGLRGSSFFCEPQQLLSSAVNLYNPRVAQLAAFLFCRIFFASAELHVQRKEDLIWWVALLIAEQALYNIRDLVFAFLDVT